MNDSDDEVFNLVPYELLADDKEALVFNESGDEFISLVPSQLINSSYNNIIKDDVTLTLDTTETDNEIIETDMKDVQSNDVMETDTSEAVTRRRSARNLTRYSRVKRNWERRLAPRATRLGVISLRRRRRRMRRILTPSPSDEEAERSLRLNRKRRTVSSTPLDQYVTSKQGRIRMRKSRNIISSSEESVIVIDETQASVTNTIVAGEKVKEASIIDMGDDLNYGCNVKVVWQSNKIITVPVRRFQKLKAVFVHIQNVENVEIDNIVLMLKGKFVRATDSPYSLDLQICDFLDGGIVDNKLSTQTEKFMNPKFDLQLKFQCSNHCIEIGGSKLDLMKVFMMAYAEQVEKPLNSLRFVLDGIACEPNDTPLTLGINNFEVIDVVQLESLP